MRENFNIEKALRISKENSDTLHVDILFGSVLPGGDAGEQDAASIGSIYIRQNGSSSTIYQKVASSNVSADWQENGSSSAAVGSWRGEKVISVTNDIVTAGVARNLTTSPFLDDDAPLLTSADFAIGDFIIADADGVPVLLEVSAIAAPSVTFSTPASAPVLAIDDTFITRTYLPDNPGNKEGQAIVNFNGSVMVKIGDIDWNFADGIQLALGYAAASGDVSDADTVQTAMQKIDGNNDAQDLLLGAVQGAINLGIFSGVTITDNNSVKGALQELETAHEVTDQKANDLVSLSGMPQNAIDLGTFTGAIITDNNSVKGALQELETKNGAQDLAVSGINQNVNDLVTLSGLPANSTNLGTFAGTLIAGALSTKSALQRIEDLLEEMKMVKAIGVTTATPIDAVPVATVSSCKWLVECFEEATPANKKSFEVYALNNGTLADDTVYGKLKLGANFNVSLSVDISGGNMRLMVSSTTAGITVSARRLGVYTI